MVSGKKISEQSFQSFCAWIVGKTDNDFRSLEIRGVLSRTDIAKECGFGKSTLTQNPRVARRLDQLETILRERGILPPKVEKPDEPDSDVQKAKREPSRLKDAQETERLRRLKQENAALKAEVAELKRVVEKYSALREALAQTGRVPR